MAKLHRFNPNKKHQMRNLFIIIFASIVSLSTAYAQHSNCSVSPYPITNTQADGSKITLYAFGNEAVHYLETSEGFTVLKNSNDIYEYAIKGLDGNLTLSGIKASDEVSVYGKSDLQKHLRYSPQQISLLVQYHNNLDEQNTTLNKSGANVFPPSGSRKIIVVLMEFPDLRSTVAKSNFDLLFNQINLGGVGSFKEYYQRTSFGNLNLSVDVYGWYMAPNGYRTYKNATTTLLSRAAYCADSAGADFSQYDSDNDGYIDAMMVMHAGIGAEEASAPNSSYYIWSFRSTWTSSPTYNHSKRVYAYAMFPERRYYTNAMVGIGVMTHEFGHILDLPDLYATNYNGTGGGPEGVGDYANMAGGPWLNNEHTPCMHDAWSRIQLGWLTPTVINKAGTYTIPKCVADSNFTYLINTGRSNEYFLLENRQLKGFDKYLPSKGLAIWHINSNMVGKLSQLGNNVNNDTSNEGLSILQADGKRDLEFGANRGDAADLFPGSLSNHNVTPYTTPNTNLIYSVGGAHQPSNIFITGITNNTDSSITFKFGSVASASFTPSVVSGCAPLKVSLTNNSVFANSYKWDFGDGSTSVVPNQNHTFSNPGSYLVTLRALDSSGAVADSMNQMIVVNTSPVAKVDFVRFGDMIHFTNSSTGATNYFWQFGTYTSIKKVLDSLDLRKIQPSGIVNFSMIAYNSNGCSDTFSFSIDIWATGVNEINANAFKIKLYPNPIEQSSTISFTTTRTEKVNIEIYNMLGEKVAVLENKELQSGTHEYAISKELLPSSGVYLVKVYSESQAGIVRLLNR
jgi:M6 family metalloprotease-like protein